MAAFLAVLECISARKSDGQQAGETSDQVSEVKTEPTEIDEQDLEEQVNDLMEIRKKDILKKNISNILRENIELKNRVKSLEEQLIHVKEGGGGSGTTNLSFLIGQLSISNNLIKVFSFTSVKIFYRFQNYFNPSIDFQCCGYEFNLIRIPRNILGALIQVILRLKKLKTT